MDRRGRGVREDLRLSGPRDHRYREQPRGGKRTGGIGADYAARRISAGGSSPPRRESRTKFGGADMGPERRIRPGRLSRLSRPAGRRVPKDRRGIVSTWFLRQDGRARKDLPVRGVSGGPGGQ